MTAGPKWNGRVEGLREPNLGRLKVIALRDAILVRLREVFPTDVMPTIEKFRGPWTDETIRRYSRRAPALMLAVEGMGPVQANSANSIILPVHFAIFAVARVSDGDADDPNIAIAEALSMVIPYEDDWGDDQCAQEAIDVMSLNRYTKSLDGTDTNLWLTKFTSKLRIEKLSEEELAAFPDFLRTHHTFVLSDNEDVDRPEQEVELNDP